MQDEAAVTETEMLLLEPSDNVKDVSLPEASSVMVMTKPFQPSPSLSKPLKLYSPAGKTTFDPTASSQEPENNFVLEEDKPAQLGAYLNEGGVLRATIKDSTGNVVDTIELGSQEAGIVHFDWAGNAENGSEPGKYKFEVELVDGENTTPVTSLVRAPVDSVTFDKGFAELRILGRLFGLGKVLEIG